MSSDHYTPNNGKNTSGQGWQYSSGSSGSNRSPKKPEFNIREWIPIFVLFCIPSGITQFIAFFWALSKVITIIKQNKEYQESLKQFGRTAANVTRDVTDAVRKEVSNAKQSSSKSASASKTTSTKKTATKKPTVHLKGGSGLIAGGAILTGIFGISTIGVLSEFISSLNYGYFFADELTGLFVVLAFMIGGIIMLGKGIGNNKRKERMLNYLAYIGSNREISLVNMALSFGVSIKTLCKDLRKMLADGILPTGYLDMAAGKLILSETGYQAPTKEEPVEEEAPKTEQEIDDSILKEIRQVNDDIPDEVMSAKIDRIEEITGKILNYQKTHPDKAGQLRSFLNYYLPTTLKILRAYAQLDAQGIEGENISAAKARIEGMMDQVVAGFEKQLDKLFQDQAMDITSDVKVLENMLKKDGLSDDQQTMTMTF